MLEEEKLSLSNFVSGASFFTPGVNAMSLFSQMNSPKARKMEAIMPPRRTMKTPPRLGRPSWSELPPTSFCKGTDNSYTLANVKEVAPYHAVAPSVLLLPPLVVELLEGALLLQGQDAVGDGVGVRGAFKRP